tara:strand:- start:339 stop:542 length:204 start_codon:yes stop_codon:yes gene_type:complete
MDSSEETSTTGSAMKTYHIYLEDKCLFKNLNQEEFELIWDKIYRSYFKEELTYTECIGDVCLEEASF